MSKKKKVTEPPMSDEAYAQLIAEVTRPKTSDEKRFIRLGWALMDAKYRYYVLDQPDLQDFEYDKLEREYDLLAKKLGVPPTAADMVGFDRTRPSCSLVADKVHNRKPDSIKCPDCAKDYECGQCHASRTGKEY